MKNKKMLNKKTRSKAAPVERGLSNPMLKQQAASKALEVVPFVLKLTLGLAIVGGAYYLWTNRFKKSSFDPSQPASNISVNEAKTRANSIYQAMKGFGANFNLVKQNLQGLNYNGWVMLYNEFGERRGANYFSKMTLTEWLIDQFKAHEIQELRFLVPFNAF